MGRNNMPGKREMLVLRTSNIECPLWLGVASLAFQHVKIYFGCLLFKLIWGLDLIT
jgi:hypothetical protein